MAFIKRKKEQMHQNNIVYKKNRLQSILLSQDGMGVVEVILIIVVLIGFGDYFPRQILKGWWHPFSPQYRKMQVQYDKYFDERGQITVFLSLLFLVLMMSFLFIVEGVISYSASSLGEDAVKGAGESIMANYDRELFKNYHLFFLDPRQKG